MIGTPRGLYPTSSHSYILNHDFALREHLRLYLRERWGVIPLKRRSKEPNLPEGHPFLYRRATRQEFFRFKFANVGITTGLVSGIIVADADGEEGLAELKKKGHPATPTVKTARGIHLYFKHPGGDIRTGIEVAPGLDVKAAGGYVVAPPSVHPDGSAYEWVIRPDEAELAGPPGWLMERIRQRSAARSAPAPLGEVFAEGERNCKLASIAGTLRRRGLGEEAILAALIGINSVACRPPLPDREVERVARSIAKYPPRARRVWEVV